MIGALVLTPLAVETARSGHIEFRAHDGFQRNAFLGHRIQELLNPEHVPVVGNSQGRLTVGHGSIDQVPYLGLTVQNRILGMNMQMGE